MADVVVAGATFHVDIDDFATPWRDHGTVFFMPGFCRTTEFWRGWVPSIAAKCQSVRFDPRGTGRSGDPGPDFRYSLTTMVEDCVAVISALGVGRVHFVGESVGGMVGVMLAALRPDIMDSLTLVSMPIRISDETLRRNAMGRESWAAALAELGLEHWWLESRRLADDLMDDPAGDAHFAREIARTPLHVATSLASIGTDEDVTQYVERVTARTLVLTPAVSANMSTKDQSKLSSAIPNSTQIVVEGATHGMYYKMPATLAGHVLRFLDG